MRKFRYILILVVFVGIFSCKKDKTPFPLEPPYNDLEHGWQDDFGDEDFIYPGWSYLIEDSLQFHVPQFNPSNADEIIYYRHDYPTNSHQLVKYNLKTTEKSIIMNDVQILNEPAWSKTGWIAFTRFPNPQIYLIKDNGSQFSQITTINNSVDPQWSENGEYIYFGTGLAPNIGLYYVRKELISNQIDTLSIGNVPGSISARKTKINNNLVLSLAMFNDDIFYAKAELNFSPLQPEPIISTNFNIQLDTDKRCWSYDNQYIYLAYHSTGKIFRVRVSDGEIELFRDQYNGNWLHSIAASPDGKYLIVERVVLSNTFTATGELNLGIRTHSQIQLIDIATKKIKILDLE